MVLLIKKRITMAYDRLVGMHVKDEKTYQRYREKMLPILHKFGGSFRHDFVVNKVMRSEAKHTITRVFLMTFAAKEDSVRFFADADYLKIREEFFKPAVGEYSTLAEYER
jgi:uncharacterized protein (DUF1330 family)